MEASESGLVITQIDKLKSSTMIDIIQHVGVNSFHYLNGFQTRKPVSTSKIKMRSVSSIPFNAVYVRFMKKSSLKEGLITKVSMMN